MGGIGPILAQKFRLLGVCFHYLALWINKIDTTIKNIYALRMVNDILSSDFEGRFFLSINLQNNLDDEGIGDVEKCLVERHGSRLENRPILLDRQVADHFLVGIKSEPGHRRKDDHRGHERPGDDFGPQAVPPVLFLAYSTVAIL